jgi:hypothetical protein
MLLADAAEGVRRPPAFTGNRAAQQHPHLSPTPLSINTAADRHVEPGGSDLLVAERRVHPTPVNRVQILHGDAHTGAAVTTFTFTSTRTRLEILTEILRKEKWFQEGWETGGDVFEKSPFNNFPGFSESRLDHVGAAQGTRGVTRTHAVVDTHTRGVSPLGPVCVWHAERKHGGAAFVAAG